MALNYSTFELLISACSRHITLVSKYVALMDASQPSTVGIRHLVIGAAADNNPKMAFVRVLVGNRCAHNG
ncbi:hypothetical protein HRI_000820500 [Hibiscus trionum]|uniref:Uncharacterized protein n=1 Tax=Hibiscus trionum TaxID=183268 RepID=A0A9W7H5R9_HIBTR|nr:hypothetical protein HRI_000820500 [Hibiscus trionum]